MKKLIEYIIIGLLIMLFIWAASCTSEPTLCSKGKNDNDVTCIEIYQPVRAPDGTIYPKSCYAEADGWDNGCLTLVNNI